MEDRCIHRLLLGLVDDSNSLLLGAPMYILSVVVKLLPSEGAALRRVNSVHR